MAPALDEKNSCLRESSGDGEEEGPSLPSSRSSERLRRDSPGLAFKHEDGYYPPGDDDSSDGKENRPPLPPRPAPSMDRDLGQEDGSASSIKYDRSKETVMAYMIPLPRPMKDGVRQDQVPQRYMLYMPPSPDRLKVPKDEGKERKRDKAVRLWQQEVKKAKTYNGTLVSLRGMECASVRGAVCALNIIKPADVTFLSRIPRKSIRSLHLMHPKGQKEVDESAEEMYEGVKEEFRRSKKRTRRDFLIGTALLPVTTAVDLVIPVFGGFSEVNLVWMVVNATGWAAAKKMTRRMVLGDTTSAPQQGVDEDDDAADSGDAKKDEAKIEVAFRRCAAMETMAQYVQAACHRREAELFAAPECWPGEAEVLSSIGWTPERQGREGISEEDDVAVSSAIHIQPFVWGVRTDGDGGHRNSGRFARPPKTSGWRRRERPSRGPSGVESRRKSEGILCAT